ncbi:DUF5069 domain-containing protein [Thalassobacterium maritimum]|uniref:DUF5069 domain-containing protein n=1 Tax=Thalassobacterium maritimum TaxID=3041265 RepID=UPI003CE5455E
MSPSATQATLKPLSPYTEIRGMLYFPRMLDKIRKHAASQLHDDFHKSFGVALDGRCCAYLRIIRCLTTWRSTKAATASRSHRHTA